MSSRWREWLVELPATLEAIETYCHDFRQWRASAFRTLDLFAAELLLREALTNSIVHGCSQDPKRRICCFLRLKPGRLLIVVSDGGGGFDWHAAYGRRSESSDTRGRGIEILSQYANAVRFNAKGNVLTLIKRF